MSFSATHYLVLKVLLTNLQVLVLGRLRATTELEQLFPIRGATVGLDAAMDGLKLLS